MSEPATCAAPFGVVELVGFSIWPVSIDVAVAHVIGCVDQKVGGWITTLNLEYLSRAVTKPDFGKLVRSADLCFADGMPLVWACRRKYVDCSRMQRIAGVDLCERLLRSVDASKIAIVGGECPAEALTTLGIKACSSVFIFDGKVSLDDEFVTDLARQLEHRSIVFLALGVGKQDLLAAKLRDAHLGAIMIGVGGTFELIAGRKPRAPAWMQSSGLEWLFRLVVEPKRLWRRYLIGYWPGAIAVMKDSFKSAQKTR